MAKQTIEVDVPDGWRAVRLGHAENGESYVDSDGKVVTWRHHRCSSGYYLIVERMITLEVGGYYETRDGDVVGPMYPQFGGKFPFWSGANSYTKHGLFYANGTESSADIVREVPTPEKWVDAICADIGDDCRYKLRVCDTEWQTGQYVGLVGGVDAVRQSFTKYLVRKGEVTVAVEYFAAEVCEVSR